MSVKLVTITPDSEKLIAYCARVSNPSNQNNEDITKLLKYCIENKHWSITEQASMTVEINTTIAIATQILRHKSFCFQQFSQRYATVNKLTDSFFEPIELRLKHPTNRQSSLVLEDNIKQEYYQKKMEKLFSETKELYNEMISDNISSESARFVLPQSTKTRLYMTGNIRSFIHYIITRCDISTQKEHRIIAEQVKEIFKQELPILSKALNF
jgi:thymidylate synthase (FAD)